MRIPFYQIDAFSGVVFGGNPAAVCLMESWPAAEALRNIAAENNLSETAFLVRKSRDRYDLRWFTPAIEVDLCGHGTLASAFVIFSFVDDTLSFVDFDTAGGRLTVTRSGELLCMDFPARKPEPAKGSRILSRALGAKPVEVLKSRDLVAVFDKESAIREMNPDFARLRQIEGVLGVIVTAPGKGADFVSRFFAPNAGIPEDPVTGSAHCTLIPYWAGRLKKNDLRALQLSARGGELICENLGERVRISGRAALYAKGDLYL